MTQAERDNYIHYKKQLYTDREQLSAAHSKGREEGEAIGLEKGEAIGLERTAVNMIKQGLDSGLISQVTGLNAEKIQKLKEKLE
jgi:predicted transposase YdaD